MVNNEKFWHRCTWNPKRKREVRRDSDEDFSKTEKRYQATNWRDYVSGTHPMTQVGWVQRKPYLDTSQENGWKLSKKQKN